MSAVSAKTISAQIKNRSVVSVNISAGTGGGEFNGETYAGPYAVTPDVDAQTLETARKYMTRNVSIGAIPYYDTGNTAGGRTVYIGKELE